MRRACLLIAIAGCGVHAGPTVGYRTGKLAVGWQAAAGVTIIEAAIGQSYGDGARITYGGIRGFAPLRPFGPTLMLGTTKTDDQWLFAGAVGFGRFAIWEIADGRRGTSGITALVTLELRWLGTAMEITASPEVGYIWFPAIGVD